MRNYGVFAGMGTAGLVGQIGTFKSMAEASGAGVVLMKILALHIALPAALSLAICIAMRKAGLIKDGDMKLEL